MEVGGQLPSHQDSQLGSGPSQMANTEHQQMLPGRRMLELQEPPLGKVSFPGNGLEAKPRAADG